MSPRRSALTPASLFGYFESNETVSFVGYGRGVLLSAHALVHFFYYCLKVVKAVRPVDDQNVELWGGGQRIAEFKSRH
jgi:hypothetical protein